MCVADFDVALRAFNTDTIGEVPAVGNSAGRCGWDTVPTLQLISIPAAKTRSHTIDRSAQLIREHTDPIIRRNIPLIALPTPHPTGHGHLTIRILILINNHIAVPGTQRIPLIATRTIPIGIIRITRRPNHRTPPRRPIQIIPIHTSRTDLCASRTCRPTRTIPIRDSRRRNCLTRRIIIDVVLG